MPQPMPPKPKFIDASNLEKLKVWYAVFRTIMNDDSISSADKIAKLEKLHKNLDLLVPEPH